MLEFNQRGNTDSGVLKQQQVDSSGVFIETPRLLKYVKSDTKISLSEVTRLGLKLQNSRCLEKAVSETLTGYRWISV